MNADLPARALLVDDHPGVAAALKVMLRLDGRVTLDAVARSAQEGLDLYDGHDVVILDLNLPDGQGAELVQRYARQLDGVPLVAHTAAGDRADLGDAAPLVFALVAKGSTRELTDTLARATGR